MQSTNRSVEPAQATSHPVLTVHIDLGQLIAAVRRHVSLSPMAARAIRNDLAKLFDTTRVLVVSSAPTRKIQAAADRATN